jgi:hypothetical protein
MAGVPENGTQRDQPWFSQLQKKVQRVCKWKTGAFSTCQPISMGLKNINFLHFNLKLHRFSLKADDTR